MCSFGLLHGVIKGNALQLLSHRPLWDWMQVHILKIDLLINFFPVLIREEKVKEQTEATRL